MKSSKQIAIDILENIGGKENVLSVTHCATRLRPKLKDRQVVNKEKIENIEGVTGVIDNPSGLQIVIGLTVGEVYNEFIKLIGNTKNDEKPQNRGLLNGFVELVVSIFSPLLPLLAGCGLLRGFTILANQAGILDKESPTNTLLTLAATSVFYFFPLLVAVTSAKRFKTNPYIAAAIMGALIMPDFINFVEGDGGNTVKFFSISIPVFRYTSQVIPAILTTYIQSKIDHFLSKRIPNALHMIVIPTILLTLLVPLTAMAIGPFSNYISVSIAKLVDILANINPIITGAVIGGIWNILIMFGVHWAPNTMVIIPEIAKKGYSPFIAYGANANFAMAGSALAVFLKTKNKKLKSFSISSIVSVMLSGIVEPALYGIGVKFKTPLITACIGAGLGGAFMGLFNVVGNAFVFGGLTTIPAFAGKTLWAYVVGLAISFISGTLLTLIIGYKEEVER